MIITNKLNISYCSNFEEMQRLQRIAGVKIFFTLKFFQEKYHFEREKQLRRNMISHTLIYAELRGK